MNSVLILMALLLFLEARPKRGLSPKESIDSSNLSEESDDNSNPSNVSNESDTQDQSKHFRKKKL